MSNYDEGSNIIALIDDQDQQHTFEVLDVIQTNEGRFVALLPKDGVEEEMGCYHIFEVVDQNGEEFFEEVDDDDLLDSLADIFEERFDSIFDDDAPEYSDEGEDE